MRRRVGFCIDSAAVYRGGYSKASPDLVVLAALAEIAGVSSIICSFVDGGRYVGEADVRRLREVLKTKLVLRLSPVSEALSVASQCTPDEVVLVPEGVARENTEEPLDLDRHFDYLAGFVRKIGERKATVTLQVDASIAQVKVAKRLGVAKIEMSSRAFVEAGPTDKGRQLDQLLECAKLANKLGLSIATGYGLDYTNIRAFNALPHVDEYWVGESIVSRALFTGIDTACRDLIAKANEE